MPVFLTQDMWDQWLRTEKFSDIEEALSMLNRSTRAAAKTVTVHPIARSFNDVPTLGEAPNLIANAAKIGQPSIQREPLKPLGRGCCAADREVSLSGRRGRLPRLPLFRIPPAASFFLPRR